MLSGCTAKLGLSSLKQEQKEAVIQFLSKRDVFVVMPTGFGKSIYYVILPLHREVVLLDRLDSTSAMS